MIRGAAAVAIAVVAAATVPAQAAARVWLLGRSVEGRAIRAVELGDPGAGRKILVVGCIHGNECAGTAIARRLEALKPSPGVDLWIVPDLNPDGHAAATRGNADGVDLNRNFPWHWRPLGGAFHSGPRPLSEPESRIAYRLVNRLRPAVTIWFHQHLDVVDDSGGNRAVERRFASRAGLRLADLHREPGSATTWQNHRYPGATAFVVELPAGRLSPRAASRYAGAVLSVVR